ncbi:integrase core domain-containing protein [Pseudomonas aeruginosa]|uniref:integrase core domain-containing protein n=1 Tax=Pseudomonas aeruginosa TaxID=287 RepID=UPI003D05103C
MGPPKRAILPRWVNSQLLPVGHFQCAADTRKMVAEAVQIYNTERPHMALKNKTPDAVHRAF